MSSRFHKIKVAKVEKTTDDCSIITLDISNGISEEFQFKQGQHLTLKAEIDGENVQRSYSLCSSPHDGEWKVGIKKVPGGKFSTYANEVLSAGDELEVMPPSGHFYIDIDKNATKHYVAIAAGSGITPIFSIIKTHLEAEPNSQFTLCYINQTVASIILKEEIEGLKNRFMDRFEIFHFLTKQKRGVELYNGRMDEAKLEIVFKDLVDLEQMDDVFICGPEEMIFTVRDFLVSKKVDEKKIHFELFTTAESMKGKVREVKEELKGLVSDVTILDGANSFNFKIHQGANNILDAALSNSADLPFACKGGVCSTCKAKLIEGKVEMDVNYALEQDEVEAGYILTCQSVPVSERVVVDFDN
ncbi:MAG: phenylacetate-CoA oxygenase/reductase subunit PaaK [Flavobacteriales bacterium]|nr:phenylacetate-CoA oxygenase/reductase subunit PaaK [Flavobacteriales bacterium]